MFKKKLGVLLMGVLLAVTQIPITSSAKQLTQDDFQLSWGTPQEMIVDTVPYSFNKPKNYIIVEDKFIITTFGQARKVFMYTLPDSWTEAEMGFYTNTYQFIPHIQIKVDEFSVMASLSGENLTSDYYSNDTYFSFGVENALKNCPYRSQRIIETSLPIRVGNSVIPPFDVNDTSLKANQTLTINANVDPYLEIALNKSSISFDNTVVGSDLDDDVTLSVKSNLNYKIDASYNGLLGEGETVHVDDKYFYISDGVTKFNPIKDTPFSVTTNSSLGQNTHAFKLGLSAGVDLPPRKYSTDFMVKVSQL